MLFAGDWLPKKPRDNRFGGISVANLECAFSEIDMKSDKAYTSVLTFDCIENIGSGGFSALSVANNHVNDAGNFDKVYVELKKRYPEIQFFGTKDNPYAEFRENGRRIIIIGCLEPCRSRGNRIFKQEDVESLVRLAKKENQSIYVYPHWGMEGEYTRYPSPKQRKLAMKWIDAGADGVFGSHSHVPQSREFYKGRPIYYSLGNFDFDHPESKLYEGTSNRLTVAYEDGEWRENFDSDETHRAIDEASKALIGWNVWEWAKTIGSFNIDKNMASWKIRMKKNPFATLPKFIVWQFLPKVILFRIASLWH